MRLEADLDQIRARAEEYYRKGEFYCSEAVVKTVVEELEIDAPVFPWAWAVWGVPAVR